MLPWRPRCLTGCDVGDALDSEDPGAEPTSTEVVGARGPENALPVGETFDGAASTTVTAIARGEGDDLVVAGRRQLRLVVGTVRTCVSAGGSTTEVGWYQWAATGVDGGWYPADLDYDRRPADRAVPAVADLTPGALPRGADPDRGPRDAEVVTFVNADQDGVAQGSWLVGDVGVPAAIGGE